MDSAREIHQEMVARRFRRDRRSTKSIRYEGLFNVRGRSVSVAVDFANPHLGTLPRLYLTDRSRDLPAAVAHVEANDRICYAREEELVLDPHNPRGSVALCMIKMQETLDRIGSGDLQDEVAREFPQHWQGASVYVDLPAKPRAAFAFSVRREGGDFVIIAESSKQLRRLDIDDSEVKSADVDKSPVALLKTERTLTFTSAMRAPCNLTDLMRFLEVLGDDLPKALLRGVTQAWPRPGVFLVRAPNGTVGGKIKIPAPLAKAVQRPQFLEQLLRKKAGEIPVDRLTGVLLDPSFIFRRNMADEPNLGGKKIALIGVGTIGGWLARFLGQSGAGTAGGRLILLDEQPLEAGNLGRHWLGLPYVGINKAIGARKELSRASPDCDVSAIAETAFKHMSTLIDCDLVIDATGEQAVSDVLNANLVAARRKMSEAPASLHVWLVGSGVAAQVLLADSPTHACFRCLRTSDGAERFRLLNPDHPVALTPANCGEGAYFAYGVGAPAIAAGLALQVCLDWAKKAPSPRFRTIRINHEATFQVKDMNAPPLEICPACAATHG